MATNAEQVPEHVDAPLCLASASPRRLTLLQSIGVAVTVAPGQVDETPLPGEPALEYVTRLALAKAQAAKPVAGQTVLGADTAVILDGDILGKPLSQAHAADMLARLAGRTHQVSTAVAVLGQHGVSRCCVTSEVRMRPIAPAEIAAYWQTGEPADKAGGYAIQGLAAIFVEQIQGSYSAVVGLPLFETARLLRQQGVAVWWGAM